TVSLSDALVGHWRMDEGSGSLLADASENGNHATATGGPAWVGGVDGLGLRFVSGGQYAAAPDDASLDITGGITVSAWIKPERTRMQFLVQKAGFNSADGYELSLSSTGQIFLRFNQASSGNSTILYSQSSYPSNGS